MTILYFTATGNNLYLATRIGGRLFSIPQACKSGEYSFSDDKIGLIFPIYGLAVPPFIEDFLQKVRLDSTYIFAVMSYGFYEGAAKSHLLEIASKFGIRFSYINTIRMVDNYLPAFDMEKQLKNEPKKQIENHLDSIIADISNARECIPKDSFFDRLMTKQYMRTKKFSTGIGFTGSYSVGDACTKCGTCASVCPTDNIQVHNAKPDFGNHCISCLACIQNCPQNAIHLSGEKSGARFRNQHVSLGEIVKSNQ